MESRSQRRARLPVSVPGRSSGPAGRRRGRGGQPRTGGIMILRPCSPTALAGRAWPLPAGRGHAETDLRQSGPCDFPRRKLDLIDRFTMRSFPETSASALMTSVSDHSVSESWTRGQLAVDYRRKFFWARRVHCAHALFMSSAKKLQGEIDRVLKAVQEGQEVFEEIWLKVHEASTAAQKEKFEGELKTQIKKLQRLFDSLRPISATNQVYLIDLESIPC